MQLIDFNYVNAREKTLAEEFLYSKKRKRYVLGINKLSRSLLRLVEVDGVIDDFTRVQRSRKKEVLRIEEVPRDAIILYTSTGSPLEVKRRLDAMGFVSLNYLALLKYTTLALEPYPFMMEFEADYKANQKRYRWLYELLEDRSLKEIFTKLINFKISFDIAFMEGFSNDHSGQYFDKSILPKLKNIVFVDGGGYVGDTAREVIKNYPDYKKIYLIEPIEQNLRIAKRDLAAFERITYFPLGLSNKRAELFFHEEKSFSALYGSGTESVVVERLDALVDERVDYIKLDIEGAELDALKGAEELIVKYKPILAVCIYHKPEHWYEVAEFVLSICNEYRLYLRHYMEGVFETVLYFIPKRYAKNEAFSSQ